MSLLLFTAENEASASMLDYSADNNSLYAKAMVNMDPNVVKYKSVAASDFNDTTNGLIVDGSYANRELNTQIIYYSKELSILRNPLFKEKSKNITQRSNSVSSYDVDNDGKIEIPVTSKLPHSENQTEEIVADKIVWNSFSDKNETLNPKINVITNYDYNYYFKIQDKWGANSVTALINSTNRTTEFYEWKSDKPGKLLFEIKAFDLDDWNSGKSVNKYTLISKNDKYAYAFKNINTDSPSSISDDEIKTGFMAVTETTV